MTRRSGKYAHVINTLPRMLGTEPDYQIKVNAVKDAMLSEPDFVRHASALARVYIGIRAEKAEAEDVMSEINLRLEAISQLMADQFEAEGVSTLHIDGRPVSVRWEPWAKVDNRETFRQWCLRDPDLSRIMTIPWTTINKITRDRLLTGDPEPPGVSIWARTRFTLGSE